MWRFFLQEANRQHVSQRPQPAARLGCRNAWRDTLTAFLARALPIDCRTRCAALGQRHSAPTLHASDPGNLKASPQSAPPY